MFILSLREVKEDFEELNFPRLTSVMLILFFRVLFSLYSVSIDYSKENTKK